MEIIDFQIQIVLESIARQAIAEHGDKVYSHLVVSDELKTAIEKRLGLK